METNHYFGSHSQSCLWRLRWTLQCCRHHLQSEWRQKRRCGLMQRSKRGSMGSGTPKVPSYPVPTGIARPACLWGSYMWRPGPPGWGWGEGLTTSPHKTSRVKAWRKASDKITVSTHKRRWLEAVKEAFKKILCVKTLKQTNVILYWGRHGQILGC